MKTLKLALWQVLRGDDLAEWEVLDPYLPREVAQEWVRRCAPFAKIGEHGIEARFVLDRSSLNLLNRWEDGVGERSSSFRSVM